MGVSTEGVQNLIDCHHARMSELRKLTAHLAPSQQAEDEYGALGRCVEPRAFETDFVLETKRRDKLMAFMCTDRDGYQTMWGA